jgi:hypothetical protein
VASEMVESRITVMARASDAAEMRHLCGAAETPASTRTYRVGFPADGLGRPIGQSRKGGFLRLCVVARGAIICRQEGAPTGRTVVVRAARGRDCRCSD